MKLSPLQTSFVASIAFHAVAVGVAVVVGGARGPTSVVSQLPPPVITIIAERLEEVVGPVQASTPEEAAAPLPDPEQFAPAVEPVVAQPPLPAPVLQPEPPQPGKVAMAVVEVLPPSETTKTSAVSVPEVLPEVRIAAVAVAPHGVPTGGVLTSPARRAQPNYRRNPEPPYPARARRLGLEGLVVLEVKVNALGHALQVEIRQSSGHDILDQAALKAVRDWEFEPARLGKVALESQIEVPVRFQLTR